MFLQPQPEEYIESIRAIQPRQRLGRLFLAAFASAFMLAFGLIVGILMVAPVLAQKTVDAPLYQPQLPLSADRDEEFLDPLYARGDRTYLPLAEVAHVAEGNWIRIPSINVNVPLVMSPSMEDKDVLDTLSLGAALYPNGILPGDIGNTFVSAHSTGEPWRGKYRFAFLRINELGAGNLIHIDYQGMRYTYRVSTKDIVRPTPEFRVPSERDVPTMTLMACWPLWSTEKRMLISAELTNITTLTP